MIKGLDELKARLETEQLFRQHDWDNLLKMIDENPTADFEFDAEKIDAICKDIRAEIALDAKEARFKFDDLLQPWLQQNAFFCEVSRWVRKRATNVVPPGMHLPTAAMCYNMHTDDVEMLYNNRWMSSLTDKQGHGTLTHEFYHLIWKHITTRRRTPMLAWNIATDMAINSIIVNNAGSGKPEEVLPNGVIIPGFKPQVPVGRKMTKEEEEVQKKFNNFIFKAPKMLASDVYFEMLMKWAEENGCGFSKSGIHKKGSKGQRGQGPGEPGEGESGEPGEGEGDSYMPDGMDMHDLWDQIPEEMKGIVEGKIQEIIRKGVKRADNEAQGWGNIPAEVRDAIRASVSDAVDWKQVLRNFCGMVIRGNRSTSMKRINKRYPYTHPGTKRGYTPRIVIFTDQSGSVDDKQLEQVFGVLRTLSKRTTFDVCPFDTSVDVKNMFVWNRGRIPELKRTRSGGTSFDCVVAFLNKPENRGKWDGAIIATDGECSKPAACRTKLAYVVTPGHKLLFDTDDLVVQMDNGEADAKRGVVR